MKLAKVMKATEHRVAGGSEYLWDCFGTNARWMEFADQNDREYADCVYDTKTNQVYQINVHIPGDDNRCVTWIDPEHEHAYVAEARRRKIEPFGAWDNVMYNTVPGSEENIILDLLNDAANIIYDHFPSAKFKDQSTSDIDTGFHKLADINSDDMDMLDVSDVDYEFPRSYTVKFTVEYALEVPANDMAEAARKGVDYINGLDNPDVEVLIALQDIVKESVNN